MVLRMVMANLEDLAETFRKKRDANEIGEGYTMDPRDARSPEQPLEIVWLLIELRVEAEDDMIPVTMPVPIMEGKTLETLRGLYAHDARMIEARIRALYGDIWLAGRKWSIYGDRVITDSRARAMFPHDRFTPGFSLRPKDEVQSDEQDDG
jgi:hypothetical protein